MKYTSEILSGFSRPLERVLKLILLLSCLAFSLVLVFSVWEGIGGWISAPALLRSTWPLMYEHLLLLSIPAGLFFAWDFLAPVVPSLEELEARQTDRFREEIEARVVYFRIAGQANQA